MPSRCDTALKSPVMPEIETRKHGGGAATTAAIYLLLFPIPIVCLVGAVLTDVAYSAGAQLMWLHFSQWLLAAGLAFGALAAIALVVGFALSRAIRTGPVGWTHLVLFFAALIVGLLDALVHTADGWTAVVPTGMALSIVGALLALASVAALHRFPIDWFARPEVRS
jgi:uncharacterized membrane protein